MDICVQRRRSHSSEHPWRLPASAEVLNSQLFRSASLSPAQSVLPYGELRDDKESIYCTRANERNPVVPSWRLREAPENHAGNRAYHVYPGSALTAEPIGSVCHRKHLWLCSDGIVLRSEMQGSCCSSCNAAAGCHSSSDLVAISSSAKDAQPSRSSLASQSLSDALSRSSASDHLFPSRICSPRRNQRRRRRDPVAMPQRSKTVGHSRLCLQAGPLVETSIDDRVHDDRALYFASQQKPAFELTKFPNSQESGPPSQTPCHGVLVVTDGENIMRTRNLSAGLMSNSCLAPNYCIDGQQPMLTAMAGAARQLRQTVHQATANDHAEAAAWVVQSPPSRAPSESSVLTQGHVLTCMARRRITSIGLPCQRQANSTGILKRSSLDVQMLAPAESGHCGMQPSLGRKEKMVTFCEAVQVRVYHQA